MDNEGKEQIRSLNTIYFYLTDGCNLRCRHCWIEPEFSPTGQQCNFIPLETMKSIITQAKPLGLTTVKLTGGEPLLHPAIHEILEYLRTEGLRVNIETNGLLCTPEIAKQIAALNNPYVSISIDGSEAETHEWMRGVDGCFAEAIQGVKNLVNVGLKPQLIMSIFRRNYQQMEALVRLAESLGAGSVKFNIVQATARGKQMYEAGETLSLDELIQLGNWVERDLAKSTKLRVFFSHPMAFRPLKSMFGTGGTCAVCGILGIIGVLANGSYAMCGIGETIPELVFGNAHRDRLKDVWLDNPMIKELREGLPRRLEGICKECTLIRICKGTCVAQNYNVTGSLWAPHWYCEEAHKRGLFPSTRMAFKTTSNGGKS